MREIKFRAWIDSPNIGRKWMTYEVDDIDWKNKDIYFESCFSVEFSGCRLMQYTGLKDKNGKEIYEGDILQIPKGDTFYEKPEEYAGGIEDGLTENNLNRVVVGWDEEDGGFAFYRQLPLEISDEIEYDNHPDLFFGEESLKDLTLIGNIYENAELCKN